MKKTITILSLAMLITVGICIAYYQSVCDEIIRFHIIAHSNSPYDQLVKMNLRNVIINELSGGLSQCRTKEETAAFLSANTEKCKASATQYLNDIGYNLAVDVSFKKEMFPKKDYGVFILPKGTYSSLKITLGDGKGKNYFCVMFPQTCISKEMTGEVNKILRSKKIIYKFRISEIFKGELKK